MSAATRTRARRAPGSRHLLGASVMILLGAFLPWIYTGAGSVAGIRGAGLWTMYAAAIGIAGSIMRSPRIAAVHAGLLALVAVGLPVWQVAHLLGKVGMAGWMPGAGLVLTLGGGVLAGFAAFSLARASRAATSG